MSMFDGMTDAHIAHAVRMAEKHYLAIGRNPWECDVALTVIRDCEQPAVAQQGMVLVPKADLIAALRLAYRQSANFEQLPLERLRLVLEK